MRRRTFLRLAAAAAVARPAYGAERESAGGRVVSIVEPAAAAGNRSEKDSIVGRGLASGMAALADLPGADAWGSIFRPDDRVAIKLNCLAGPRLAPRREVVDAIVLGLASAGIPEEAIVLFDRTSGELERSGFPVRTAADSLRCFGTDALKGGGYGTEVLEHRSIGSLFTRILTEHATALVNVGVCKDHDLAGISAGGKNLYGLIHNPNRYHANACDPYVADLLDHPAVKERLRLTVIDAGTVQCHGGPAFYPAYAVRGGRILLSRDPVAVDRIAWEMIEKERARQGLPTLAEDKREPKWIATAGALGLGTAALDRIDLREVAA